MMSERAIGVLFAGVLLAVVAAASVAMRARPSLEQVAVENLPACVTCDGPDPSEEQCVESGGEVRYRRSSECVTEPDVHDVCWLGVPCFTEGNGSFCREVKDPYCHCESDDQCPDAYFCQFEQRSPDGKSLEPIPGTGQCQRVDAVPTGPVRILKSIAPSL